MRFQNNFHDLSMSFPCHCPCSNERIISGWRVQFVKVFITRFSPASSCTFLLIQTFTLYPFLLYTRSLCTLRTWRDRARARNHTHTLTHTHIQRYLVCSLLKWMSDALPSFPRRTFTFSLFPDLLKKINKYIYVYNTDAMGRYSSVGIATRHGLDGPWIECRWGRDFPHPSRPASVAHPASCTTGTGSFSRGKAAGAWCWPPTPSKCRGHERVGLYLYSPSGSSWPVTRRTNQATTAVRLAVSTVQQTFGSSRRIKVAEAWFWQIINLKLMPSLRVLNYKFTPSYVKKTWYLFVIREVLLSNFP